jgi:hypothetical protein
MGGCEGLGYWYDEEKKKKEDINEMGRVVVCFYKMV